MKYKNTENGHKNYAEIRGDIVEVKALRTTGAGVPVINFSVGTKTIDEASGRELDVLHYCALFGDEAYYFADNESRYRGVEVCGPTRPVRFTVMGSNDVSRSEILVTDFKFCDAVTSTEVPPSRAVRG